MSLEALEPVLYLPDDTPFYPEGGDHLHPLRLFWRAVALVVLAQAAFLWVYRWAGFVWQDDARIVQNTMLWSWGGLARVWAESLGGTYAPLTQTLLWSQHHFFGQSAAMYHAVSVLMHGIDAALLWMVLRRLGVPGAWLGAALFAVHPVQVQTVAWASQQSHVLGAGFSLGAIWAFLRLARIHPAFAADITLDPGETLDDYLPPEPTGRLLILSIVLSAAAVLSDPLGVVIPLVLVVLIWRQNGRVTRVQWMQLAPLFVIAAAGAWVALAAHRGGADIVGSGPLLSAPQRVFVACRAAWLYAAAVVDPYPLMFVYPRWDATLSAWWQWLFPAGLVLAAAVSWGGRKTWGRWPLAGVLLFLVLLLPAFWTILGVSGPAIFVADHLEYLAAAVPLAAIAALIVSILSLVGGAVAVRSWRLVTALACLGGLAFMAWLPASNSVYKNAASCWKATLAQDPYGAVARAQYAQLLLRQHQTDHAADVLQDVEPGDGSDPMLLQTRARLYLAQERYSDAIASYLAVQRIEPGNSEIIFALAEAYADAGRIGEALSIYNQVLAKHPKDAYVQVQLGVLEQRMGPDHLAKSIEHFRAALAINPRSVAAKLDLANVLFLTGQRLEAAKQLHEVQDLDPNNFVLYVNDAAMLYRLRDFQGVERMCRVAVELNPKSAEAWDYLGIAQAAQKNLAGAVWSFDRAVRANPDFVQAQRHLAAARQQLKAASSESAAQ